VQHPAEQATGVALRIAADTVAGTQRRPRHETQARSVPPVGAGACSWSRRAPEIGVCVMNETWIFLRCCVLLCGRAAFLILI
jgi:hypothetical protein